MERWQIKKRNFRKASPHTNHRLRREGGHDGPGYLGDTAIGTTVRTRTGRFGTIVVVVRTRVGRIGLVVRVIGVFRATRVRRGQIRSGDDDAVRGEEDRQHQPGNQT